MFGRDDDDNYSRRDKETRVDADDVIEDPDSTNYDFTCSRFRNNVQNRYEGMFSLADYIEGTKEDVYRALFNEVNSRSLRGAPFGAGAIPHFLPRPSYDRGDGFRVKKWRFEKVDPKRVTKKTFDDFVMFYYNNAGYDKENLNRLLTESDKMPPDEYYKK